MQQVQQTSIFIHILFCKGSDDGGVVIPLHGIRCFISALWLYVLLEVVAFLLEPRLLAGFETFCTTVSGCSIVRVRPWLHPSSSPSGLILCKVHIWSVSINWLIPTYTSYWCRQQSTVDKIIYAYFVGVLLRWYCIWSVICLSIFRMTSSRT